MKKAIILIVLLLLPVASAADLATPPAPAQGGTDLSAIETKALILEQNALLRAHIEQDLAKRDAANEQRITSYIDENFQALDNRIDQFIRRASFKLGMVFFSGLVMGGTILLLINNQLRRKRAIKKRLPADKETFLLSGQTMETIKEEKELPKKRGRPKKEILPTPQEITKTSYESQTIKPLEASK